jgi:hypothetical protein
MKSNNILSLITILVFAAIFTSCDKSKPYDVTVAPAQAHFLGKKFQVYEALTDPAPAYYVELGTTDAVGSDRTITYNVNPGTAVLGTHYNIEGGNNGTITIPANGAVARIAVTAVASFYTNPTTGIGTGRKDTLVFTLAEPSIAPAGFMDTVKLVIKGACFEGDVNLSELLGDYANTNEDFGGAYGPYTTTISSVTPTSATTGDIVVENIYDNGWGPITFNLDWSDPANRTVTLQRQFDIAPASTVTSNAAYATWNVMVDESPVLGPGTFSACTQKLTLNMRVGVRNPAPPNTGGFFGTPYTVVMER